MSNDFRHELYDISQDMNANVGTENRSLFLKKVNILSI